MQHGESYSFFLNNARKEYLKDHVFGQPGAEAMATVSGFGGLVPRASYFKDNLSVIDDPTSPNVRHVPRRKKAPQTLREFIMRPGEGKEIRRVDPSGEYMLLDGAVVNTRPPLDLLSRFTLTTISERLEEFFRLNPFITPSLIARLFYPGAKQKFERDGSGRILQGREDGGEYVQEEWTESGGWQPVAQPRFAQRVGPSDVLLAPMSMITEAVAAGQSRLVILDQVALQTPGDFFRPGDRVVINPGGATQEIRVVQALGSLILSQPLQFKHEEGEMVAMLPPVGPTVSITGLAEGGEVNGRTGLELSVRAGSLANTITRVEFFAGAVRLGESTGPEFRLPWLPLANGPQAIRAIAYDDQGGQTTSETVNVVVNHIGTWSGPVKASYSGLLNDEPATPAGCGTATLTSTAAGGFTMQFALAGKSYRAIGVFDETGIAIVELKRGKGLTPLRVRLTASTAPLVDQVVGEITDGVFAGPVITGASFTAAFSLDRSVWDAKKNPAPHAGPYTLVLGADAFAKGVGAPLGDGAAALNVTAAGKVKLAAKLADGTAFAMGGLISKDGRLPVYAPLYKKKGMLCGWFRFVEQPETSDGAGRLDWQRPQDPKAKVFSGGFATHVDALASRYQLPAANARMIPLVNLGGNLNAVFEGGDLTFPLTRLATMDGGSRVVVPIQGAEGLVIQTTPKTGIVSGRFAHPETGVDTAFMGTMFQKQGLISGWFLGGPQGGGFTLGANPSWTVTPADAAPLGAKLPRIAVKTPRAGQVLTAGENGVTVTGTAAHATGISRVVWQVLKNGLLSEPATATGTTAWQFIVPLQEGEGGLITIFVKAQAVSGEQSNVVTTTFRVLATADLLVSVEGPGAVTRGFEGTTQREVGRVYQITAIPARGKKFLGWTGSRTSTARTISFVMEEGFSVLATFGD